MVAVAPKPVLVAEDSADTRALLRRALASFGYRVAEAAAGRAAVFGGAPDLPAGRLHVHAPMLEATSLLLVAIALRDGDVWRLPFAT
jgi:DNA-binding response OmpR family regulator